MDAGVKRKRPNLDISDVAKKMRTERDFLNARREACRQGASSSSSGLDFHDIKSDPDIDAWDENHEKEMIFIKKSCRNAKSKHQVKTCCFLKKTLQEL